MFNTSDVINHILQNIEEEHGRVIQTITTAGEQLNLSIQEAQKTKSPIKVSGNSKQIFIE